MIVLSCGHRGVAVYKPQALEGASRASLTVRPSNNAVYTKSFARASARFRCVGLRLMQNCFVFVNLKHRIVLAPVPFAVKHASASRERWYPLRQSDMSQRYYYYVKSCPDTLGGAHMAQFVTCAYGTHTSQKARCMRHPKRLNKVIL